MIIIFIIGIILGSFWFNLIIRLENNEGWIFSRSHCCNCKESLRWYDLIPIFSYLFLKGKCRYCGKKIGIIYLLAEFISGLLLVVFYNCDIYWISRYLFCIVLSMMAYQDYYHQEVDVWLFIAGLIACLFQYKSIFWLYGFSILAVFLLIYFMFKNWFGLGDGLVFSLIGLSIGRLSLVCIYFSFLLGGILSGYLLLNKTKSKTIPFIPFITLSFIGTLLCSYYFAF